MNDLESLPFKKSPITEVEIQKQTLELDALDVRHSQEMAHLALLSSKDDIDVLGKLLTAPTPEAKD